MNPGARSQLNFANAKSDFSFRNEYISNNNKDKNQDRDFGTKSNISITVPNPLNRDRDRSAPRDATSKDASKIDKSTNSHVAAQGAVAGPRRDRSENITTKDHQEYSMPPPNRSAPTYNAKPTK